MSTAVAGLLSVVAARLLRAIECIPVSQAKKLLQSYRLRGEYLENGKSILVFPEDPALPADEETGMRPFKCGFARLGQIFFARTQQNPQIFPLAVHARLRKVQLGKANVFNPPDVASKEHVRIARLLESTLRTMVGAQLHPPRRSLQVAS